MKIDKKYFILADKEKTPPGREFALFVLYTLLVPFLFVLTCVPVGFAALAVADSIQFLRFGISVIAIYMLLYIVYIILNISYSITLNSRIALLFGLFICVLIIGWGIRS